MIARCLQKDPAARFASIADLAAALEPFASTERGAAERMRRIAMAPATEPSSWPRVGPLQGRTDVAWAETELDTTDRTKRVSPLLIAVAIGVAILVAAAIVVPLAFRPTPARVAKDPAAAAGSADAGADAR